MTDASGQRCGTCQYSEWQVSPKGNRLRSVAGSCGFVVPIPIVPRCYRITLHAIAIWPDDGKDCPTWHAK